MAWPAVPVLITITVVCVSCSTDPAHQVAFEGEKLYYAACLEDLDAVEHLLNNRHVDPNIYHGYPAQKTALHCAACYETDEMVKLLIGKGRAVVEVRDRNGYQPIHYAAAWGETSVLKVLLDYKADVNAPGGGSQPLIIAAAGIRPEMLQYLLSVGADVHAKDARGNTALHFAASKKDKQMMSAPFLAMAKTLIKYGAKINVINRDGMTPITLANQTENYDVKTFLENSYILN